MAVLISYPAGSRTGVGGTDRTLVQPYESIGEPDDAAATSLLDENSAFSLVKGILAVIGLPAGSGEGVVNITPHVNANLLDTLGDEHDAPAIDAAAANSAISLLKGILAMAGG